MHLNRPLALAVAVLAGAGLFFGCGVVEAEFNPGVAGQVGDVTVTNTHVDEVARDYCVAVEDQITEGSLLPMRILKSGIAGQLVMASAAEQLAEEYGVEPSDQYQSELATLKSQTTDLDEDVAASYVEVNSASIYVGDVLTSVGGIELEEAGQTDATIEERQAAGLQALDEWATREGVEFDPRYGLEFTEGQPAPVDTDISYPAGDLAKAGALSEPDEEYAASLPDDLVCG